MIVDYYGPAHELNRRLIEVLRSDPRLGSLLFPAWSPTPLTPDDTRIYNAHVAIDDPKLLQVLPRIIVECQQAIFDAEQVDPKSGPVNVWFHCIVPKDQYDHAEAMDIRIRTIIASTYLTSSRIIASGLNEVAPRRRTVETAFFDAWRITSAFEAPNIGVLAT